MGVAKAGSKPVVCGQCQSLVSFMGGDSGGNKVVKFRTCKDFCAKQQQGLQCTGAYNEAKDNCIADTKDLGCEYDWTTLTPEKVQALCTPILCDLFPHLVLYEVVSVHR